jgi:hypothetical protein
MASSRRGAAVAVLVMIGLVVLAPAPARAANEQRLVAPDGSSQDVFGHAVAIDGDVAVVGAPQNDLGRGAVYVFLRSGNAWTQIAKLTASDGAVNDRLGDSVAIFGDTIVAGADGDDIGANGEQGSVYTFARTGSSFRTQTAKLTISDGASSDFFGFSVAIDANVIVAGAPNDDPGATNTNQGAAYVFSRSGGNRTESAKLTASDGSPSDSLGLSVGVDEGVVAVGATGAGGVGAAYTFSAAGSGAQSQTGKLVASDGATSDLLGASVAIDGDVIVAGAYGDDVDGHTNQGSVYTFAATGAGTRVETAKLTASDGAPNDQLGYSTSILGDAIVAGANLDDVGDQADQGSAYLFSRTGPAARTETMSLIAPSGLGGTANDRFGSSVAMGGDATLVGARLDDSVGDDNRGSAVVFYPPRNAPCADGADNDGDTLVDFPQDPGCLSATDDSELNPLLACDDDVDNDHDGLTDFPTDPGCSGPTDNDETTGVAGDVTAPQTTIIRGPSGSTESSRAKLKFTGSDNATAAGSLSFECRLDKKKFTSCTSPSTFKNLKAGKHKLQVRAVDGAGNVDPTPAKRSWKVTSP